ncbi:30S ribosomal protein S15 [Candidatus Geothermarchaeota archaeon]|nr:MAG: 30S ribosomal protein S15 [Candidatus Geothermarchaeota archaeon]HEW93717.1 30S ribosomal protein S15 [Thermoprotei archaeon]
MARMHIRRKGKSHSKRPVHMVKPDWLKLTPEEVKEIALKLAREGKYPSEIGMILRDQYGVPTFKQVTGMKLSEFLEKEGIKYDYPEDLARLIEKAKRLTAHLKVHKKDYRNKHALELIEAKIHHLAKYYKRIGKLPKDWRYRTVVAKIE